MVDRSKLKKTFFFLPLLLLHLTGCVPRLQVQSQYITHDYLASSRVDSPDPKRLAPLLGKRLLINWNVPQTEELELRLLLLTRNLEESEFVYAIRPTCKKRSKGTYVYDLINEDYVASGGILAYRVELLYQGNVLEEWNHPLWVKIIRF